MRRWKVRRRFSFEMPPATRPRQAGRLNKNRNGLLGPGLVFLNGRGDGVDGLHHFPCYLHVGKFQAVIFFQRDGDLQRVHRIQSQAGDCVNATTPALAAA